MPNPIEQAVEAVARDMVHVRRVNGAVFLNLPMFYPDGSHVTVRVDRTASGMRVTDAGFTYREAADIGVTKQAFGRVVNKLAESAGVSVEDRALFTEANEATLERSVYDVAEVSWRAVHVFYERAFEEEETQLSDDLTARLKAVFGNKVEVDAKVVGTSTTEWPVTAMVELGGTPVIFQAVTGNSNSINRASTAFRDLSTLDDPPRLVAFVRSKAALGSRLALLAPGKVLEEAQPNDYFIRAAA